VFKEIPLLLSLIFLLLFALEASASPGIFYKKPSEKRDILPREQIEAPASKPTEIPAEKKPEVEKAEKKEPARPQEVKGAAKEEKVEEASVVKEYLYDPKGKPDPFQSFIAEQEPMEEKVEKKPKTYLETLDISQLDLIAIILGPGENWAMVRDAKGMGYMIKKGTPIGVHDGVVHEIRDKEVIIREQYKDYRRGQMNHRDVSKKLHPPQ